MPDLLAVSCRACLIQFLGLARSLFSSEYGLLVEKEKEILELKYRREQFIAMLQEVSREIIDEQELGVALTPDSIQAATTRLQSEITTKVEQKDAIIQGALAEVRQQGKDETPADVVEHRVECTLHAGADRFGVVHDQATRVARLAGRLVELDGIEHAHVDPGG